MKTWSIVVGVALLGALTQSCGSDASDTTSSAGGASAGNGGAGQGGGAGNGVSGGGVSGSGAGTAGSAGNASGGGGAGGSSGASGSAGTAGTAAGGAGMAGMSGEAGASGAGAAGPGVAETSCTQSSDCVPVCQANGWPDGRCYGAITRYCSCVNNGATGPKCTAGTTEGCPAGTACRLPSNCIPYGNAVDSDPCDNGDECAVGFICVGYGGALPNGSYTACRRICDPQQPAPSQCNMCTGAGYCDFEP